MHKAYQQELTPTYFKKVGATHFNG